MHSGLKLTEQQLQQQKNMFWHSIGRPKDPKFGVHKKFQSEKQNNQKPFWLDKGEIGLPGPGTHCIE